MAVLPFDTVNGLFDVGQDGSVQKVVRAALADKLAKHTGVERVRDRVPLIFRIGQTAHDRSQKKKYIVRFYTASGYVSIKKIIQT